MPCFIRSVRTLFAATALCALAPFAAARQPAAAGVDWINSEGGLFGDANNWSLGRVPNRDDTAYFQLQNTYSILADGEYSIEDMWFNYGEVTLELGGNTITVLSFGGSSPGLQIGADRLSDATVHVRNGTLRIGTGSIADIGSTAVDLPRGLFTLSGADTRMEVLGSFSVAESGDGVLVVEAGAVVDGHDGSIAVGANARAVGFAAIRGEGSLASFNNMYVAVSGSGTLLVDDGGTLTTGRVATLGIDRSGDGIAVIRGPQSSWVHERRFSDTRFVVGEVGTGLLALLDGGSVQSDVLVQITERGTLAGDGTINADLASSGLISPGGSFDDIARQFIHAGTGTLAVAGSIELQDNGVLAMELGGTFPDDFDALWSTSTVALDGTLRLSILDDFVPAMGDSFTLIAAHSFQGNFATIEAPTLPGNLYWDFRYLEHSFDVVVLPNPGTTLAFMLFGSARLGRPRRQE